MTARGQCAVNRLSQTEGFVLLSTRRGQPVERRRASTWLRRALERRARRLLVHSRLRVCWTVRFGIAPVAQRVGSNGSGGCGDRCVALLFWDDLWRS